MVATEPPSNTPIHLPGAQLSYCAAFLPPAEAESLLLQLREEIVWEQHRIRLFGRDRAVPRLSCWIGDTEARYRYSGSDFEPRPWTPQLLALRDRLEAHCAVRFNSVLANRYRSGQDSMGWHADDEPELGPQPVIASLSLGATRRFVLRSRDGRQRYGLDLTAGSLLLMAGDTQQLYQHALPKTARAVGERLNLTFRLTQQPIRPR